MTRYHKVPKRVISILMILVISFNMLGCDWSDKKGEELGDKFVDDYQTMVTNALEQQKEYDPNGTILYEDKLYEDILKEDILTEEVLLEEQLREKVLNELIKDELIIKEKVLIESVNVEVVKNIEEWDGDTFFCDSYYETNLDYSLIKENFAKGSSLIITEVVIDLGSAILDIVTAQWGMLALDLGQIVIMAGGTTLKSFIDYHIAKAKSEAAGNSYEVVMYDALDAASKSFYYTAVVLDKVMTVISLVQLVAGIKKLAKELKQIKLLKELKKTAEFVSENEKILVKIVDDTFEVVTDSGETTTKCLPALLKNATDVDLYDIVTKKYICTLVKKGDEFVVEVKKLPNVIRNSKRILYEIDDSGNIYKIVTDSAEKETKKLVGTVDQGGFITDGLGRIIERVDFDTGKTLKCYNGINNIASNISVDVFGNIVDINTGEKLSTKSIDGITYFLDSNNNKILQVYDGKDNVKYLKTISNTDNGRTVGQLTEEGLFDSGWKIALDASRSDATKTIRKKLVEFVKNHKDTEIRKLFPDLTLEQIDYIRTYEKIPQTIQIHHCKNVANYPDLAHDFTNLEVMSQESHLAAHGGSYLNSTTAKSSNYVDLKELFDLVNEEFLELVG